MDSATPRPAEDVTRPVENPELAAALQEFVKSRDARAEQELAHQLRRAVFLIPILADEMHLASAAEPGSQVLEPGQVKLISCTDAAGAQHLPLFTDWAAIRAWTGDRQVSTFAVPAADAWEMVLSREEYAGAVINPGGGQHALPLAKQTIAYLRGDMELEGADEVEDAIERLVAEPTEPNRVDLYIALQKSRLYLAAVNLPADASARSAESQSTPVQILTASAPDGSTVVLAFTSVEELHKGASGTPSFVMRGVDVLRLVAEGPYSGLVVNPRGAWALVPKLDAEVVASDATAREQA